MMSSKQAEMDDYTTVGNDAEERKKNRRKRIEIHTTTEAANLEHADVTKDAALTKTGAQQVSESLMGLDNRKHSGLQDVTSVRVNTNDSEARRRMDDEELRRSRLAKLQREALASAKANAAIEMKWGELLEKEIPQELHHDIQIQMDSCAAIIKSKDDLIGDFQQQLRAKDEEYVRTLKQQHDDINELINRIRSEFKELQFEYSKELDTIEDAYFDERDRFISDHTNEIDDMFEQRRNKEQWYKETKQANEEKYQLEVENLITKGADDYNKLKIDLEMNIQALKQQLEEIRATYQLNTEKLDYNYRVLTELDVEKNAELARYKRRLNKLKGQLNLLVTRFTEMEATDTSTNHKLTEDYRGLTLKYKDLQAKFRHFEIADTTKYDEVWTMHEEEVKDLVDQLLKADKIISEQQLGWRWKNPDMVALQHVLGRHGGLGLGAAAVTTDEDDGLYGDGNVRPSSSGEDPGEVAQLEAMRVRKVAGTRVRAVLKLLATQAGFMLNPLVAQSVESMPEEYGEVTRAESMLKALGVKTEDRLNKLVSYFFIAKNDTFMDGTDGDAEYERELQLLLKDPPDDIAELTDMIKPEDVIAAVKAYIEDMNVEAGPVGVSATSGTKNSQEEIRVAQRRLQSMRNYWLQLAQIVSDDTTAVWKQLEGDCVTVKEMLEKRTSTIAEVDALTAQNAELKALLNQYLGDTVTNAAYRVPPAQVMKVRDVTAQHHHPTLSISNKLSNAGASSGSSQRVGSKTNSTGGVVIAVGSSLSPKKGRAVMLSKTQ